MNIFQFRQFGMVLTVGVKKASEIIGKGVEYAVYMKGGSFCKHDPLSEVPYRHVFMQRRYLVRGSDSMNCIAIQTSPNEKGLTASLAQAVLQGVKERGGTTELIHLNQYDIMSCIACDTGWGQCRDKGTCILTDDFETLRQKLVEADSLVFATPVYFGGLSESAARFLDRLRRCERSKGFSTFTDKKMIGITSAGGSGRGAVRALYHLEDYLRRFGFEILDLVSVTRFSKDYKLPMLKAAGQQLVGP